MDAILGNHHLKGKIEVEDTLSAYITYPNTKIYFYATTAYIKNSAPLIELECENMRIRMEEMEVLCYLPTGTCMKIPVESKAAIGKSYWGSGHASCIQDFYDSITKKRNFSLDFSGVEETIRLMLLIYKSGRIGKEQNWQDI